MSATPRGGAALLVLRATLCAAALAGVGVFHVWSHTRVTSAGYRLDDLRRSREALRVERNRLEVEVATLRAPGRLQSLARARLGMAPPAPGAVVAGRAWAAVAGRADGAGGEESLRLAPAEPAVRAAVVETRRHETVALGEASSARHRPE
jgi:cell division protein FtsL